MKQNKRKYLLINLVTVVAVLVIAEVVSRIVLNKIYNRDFDASLIEEHKYFSSPGLKENASGIVWGKNFNTDQCGGRKNRAFRDKKKNRLYIGDSVTEGVGVDDSSTFCYKLSEKDDSFNCENISLIGYSSSDYLNVLRKRIATDSLLTNVVLCFCLNDVYGSAKTSNLPLMGKQSVAGKLNSILQQRYATYKLLKLLVFQNANRYFHYDLQFYNESNQYFNEAMKYLSLCDSMCKANNIHFAVVMLPYRSQLSEKDLNNRTPQKLVKNFCRVHDIYFADVSNHLAGLVNPTSLYLFADEIHFSARGHSAVAEFLMALPPIK